MRFSLAFLVLAIAIGGGMSGCHQVKSSVHPDRIAEQIGRTLCSTRMKSTLDQLHYLKLYASRGNRNLTLKQTIPHGLNDRVAQLKRCTVQISAVKKLGDDRHYLLDIQRTTLTRIGGKLFIEPVTDREMLLLRRYQQRWHAVNQDPH